MKNINYYLKKYGDISFKDIPFNEIDALILCQIGYLNIDTYSHDSNGRCYLKDILIPENAYNLCYNTMSSRKNMKMVKIFSKTSRYDEIYFMHFSNILCTEKIQQFFAVSFFVDEDIFISYRGTDLTIIGWHENFNMTFLESIPSQRNAVDYINFIYDKYHKKIMVGGHSKGGNLALYSAMYSRDDVVGNIISIYNFDGPGFNNANIYNSFEFKRIHQRLITLSSKMSIIAILMYYDNKIQFLKTSSISLLQHESFNWHIDNKNIRLKRVNSNSKRSKLLSKITDSFMENTTLDERKKLVDILFYIAKESPKSSLLDIKKHPIRYFSGMKSRKKLLTTEEISFYKKETKKFRKIIAKTIKDNLKKK